MLLFSADLAAFGSDRCGFFDFWLPFFLLALTEVRPLLFSISFSGVITCLFLWLWWLSGGGLATPWMPIAATGAGVRLYCISATAADAFRSAFGKYC